MATLVDENFVTDSKGKRIAVLLPIKKYNKMLEELEEYEDIKAYDEVKSKNETSIPFQQYLKERKKGKDA